MLPLGSNRQIGSLGYTPPPLNAISVELLLDDQFTDTVAAGSVPGTACTPGPGTRNGVDTASHLSVTGGRLRFNQYASQGNDPRTYSEPQTRAQGLALAFDFYVNTAYSDAFMYGWMTGTGTGLARFVNTLYFHSAAGNVNYWNGSSQVSISTDFTSGVQRKFFIILRASGCYVVQASADLTTFTLRHVATNSNTATMYAGGANRISSAGTFCEVDNKKIAQLGGGWLTDAYAAASVPLEITGVDKQWLEALC